jgi:hypothetical protein
VETAPREAVLRFDGAVTADPFDGLADRLPGWVAWTTVGYDSILIRTRQPVRWSLNRGERELTLGLAPRPDAPGEGVGGSPARPVGEDGSEQRLRRLEARLAAEAGELRAARRRQDALVARAPRTPGFLGDRALTESRLGLWRPAAASYHRAMAFGGDPAGHAGAQARLLRDHGPRVRLSLDRQVVRDADRQWITRLAGRDTAGPRAEWGLTVAGRQVTAPDVLRADGRTTRVDTSRGRAELWLEAEAGGAGHLRGTVSCAGSRTGGALRYRHRLDRTRLEAVVAANMPLWDYVGGIVDQGRRDRLEVAAGTWREGRWEIGARTGPRRYHIRGQRDLAGTWATTLRARRWLELRPELSLGYSLDWETVHSRRDPVDADGPYRPLGINSRRVHSLDASAADTLADYLRYEAGIGISVDRPNEAYGPFLQVALRYRPLPRMEAGLTLLRADGTYRGEPAIYGRAGLYVMVHPWP